jgi:putative DNA methylase
VNEDKRLIEDYLPIEKISAEASREKSVRKGHISTLHLWWARRPLVACRAAVYGALVPASRFVPNGASTEKKKSLGRANAAKFVERLCKYPGDPIAIAEAQRHILEAHADRLTLESGKRVTTADIVEGRVPRPKVLDMFAGGGAIPLEALRLGCEAYALDLNPVAYIIELCTLAYPQMYGKPDPSVRGMTGPKNAGGENTWGGLVEEVRYWAMRVIAQVRTEIGSLYPLIPDPEFKGGEPRQTDWLASENRAEIPEGYLVPVSYMWTRTVTCPNPSCSAVVPLARQTWISKKAGRYIASTLNPDGKTKRVRFEVIAVEDESLLGFDPGDLSKRGSCVCPFCQTAISNKTTMEEGEAGRLGIQPIAIGGVNKNGQRIYVSPAEGIAGPTEEEVDRRLENLRGEGFPIPYEPIPSDKRESFWCRSYGLRHFKDVFTKRQLCALLTFCKHVRSAHATALQAGISTDHAAAVACYLGILIDRVANQNNSLCIYSATRETVEGLLASKRMPMTWDFVEANPIGPATGNADGALDWILEVLLQLPHDTEPAQVSRGSATETSYPEGFFDAVITDPPYYDNISYSDLSDFFFVWLKRSIGNLFPEDFAAEHTPKKVEAIAHKARHGGNLDAARRRYEELMALSFERACRSLKEHGLLVVVYAHKTTLGWTTLVGAIRTAKMVIEEAWPLDTELPTGMVKKGKAMLASSIFLIARKRDEEGTGRYDDQVQPELQEIVRERVETLWEMGVSGADLVIACVGAGLRAFTRFARVEYPNGEEVPAEHFLTEVETVVLESILGRLSREVGGERVQTSLAGLDAATRFYILWRYTYGAADLEAGEAIIFANGTHVELDGAQGLSSRAHALAAKNKGKYHLLDYIERGHDTALGMPAEDGQPRPLIDALHRLMWLMERHPSAIPDFLRDARPNTEQMRLVAQALAGPALKGGELDEVATGTELAALTKLTSNWRSVVEDVDLTRVELEARRSGQSRIQFEKGGRR